jgi:hypothetical protein
MLYYPYLMIGKRSEISKYEHVSKNAPLLMQVLVCMPEP